MYGGKADTAFHFAHNLSLSLLEKKIAKSWSLILLSSYVKVSIIYNFLLFSTYHHIAGQTEGELPTDPPPTHSTAFSPASISERENDATLTTPPLNSNISSVDVSSESSNNARTFATDSTGWLLRECHLLRNYNKAILNLLHI